MVKKALLSVFLVVTMASGTAAAATAAEEAVQEFMETHGPQAMITLDERSQGAEFVGLFRSAPIPGDPDVAAFAFLSTWEALMGFDPLLHLEPWKVQSVSTLSFVALRQVHEGIPVEHGVVKVTIDGWGIWC